MARLYPADFEKVVFLNMCGKNLRQIQEETGISDTSAGNIIRTFTAIKGADWERLEDQVAKGISQMTVVNWAAHKLSVEIPQSIRQAYLNKTTGKPYYPKGYKQQQPQPSPAPEPEPEPQKEEPKTEDEKTNEDHFFETLLRSIQIQISYLKGIYNKMEDLERQITFIKKNNDTNTRVLNNIIAESANMLKETMGEEVSTMGCCMELLQGDVKKVVEMLK